MIYSKLTGMYLNELKRKGTNMERYRIICALLDLGIGQCFVNRGKVTEIKTEEEKK